MHLEMFSCSANLQNLEQKWSGIKLRHRWDLGFQVVVFIHKYHTTLEWKIETGHIPSHTEQSGGGKVFNSTEEEVLKAPGCKCSSTEMFICLNIVQPFSYKAQCKVHAGWMYCMSVVDNLLVSVFNTCLIQIFIKVHYCTCLKKLLENTTS